MTIKITKGLDLSLEGEINHQVLPEVKSLTSRLAILGKDFLGIRPTMFVSEGQQVSQGEKLFEDKKNLDTFTYLQLMERFQKSIEVIEGLFFQW